MDPKMEPVHNFTNELFSLYDYKIPISKAKMGSVTKSAMKAIKFYKHVVQSVEKFILKCKPEYKIPGLYVIDSIVRQSRHQFGAEKDVFAPRFSRNMEETFAHLFRCSQEDKSKIIRVLNLWQKNNVFAPDIIQPLFDLANPEHPVHLAYMQQQQNSQGDLSNGMNIVRESPSQKDESGVETLSTMNVQKFQYQQQMMMQQPTDQNMETINQLLEFDYGSDGDDDKGGHQTQSAFNFPYNNLSKCLEDPNVLKQLQNINQFDMQRYLSELPGASNSMMDVQQGQNVGLTLANINSLRGPPPAIDNSKDQDVELIGDILPAEVIIPVSSRSPTPTRHKRRKSRSRSREKGRYGRRRRTRSRSRSRSYSRSPRSKRRSSRDRMKEKEREVEKERRRKGLPDIKKDHLSVCSTTLWVGHLSKLVQQEELSDTFGKYGDIISIDMIPPRGCAYIVMNRRQDAYKAMLSLKNYKMQNRVITISWAAGKGVKSKEWKDYFDQTLGVTYIPFGKLNPTTDFETLEEGGMYDEDTMPAWVKEKMKQPQIPAAVVSALPQYFPPSIDTSQPPPNASLLPTMPPFALGARSLLMSGAVPAGLMGIGVPPPNMLVPSMLGLPPGLLGFQLPPAAAQAVNTINNTSNQQQQHQTAGSGDDHMDIEMEDENSSAGPGKNDHAMFFNQPPPINIAAMIMGANNNNSNNDQQQSGDNNNRMNIRNNRSVSRDRDSRQEYRSRGSRDRNDRRSGGGDFNSSRNSRWPNDSNGRDRSRSRDGGQSHNNFNRRAPGHQQDIPSLMQPQQMAENDTMPARQRGNDYGGRDSREDYDRRQGFSGRGGGGGGAGAGGFQQMRGGRGSRGGQFGGRGGGGMRGFSNNFNDRSERGSSYHERESSGGYQEQRNRGSQRNWRDEGDDRRNFQPRSGNPPHERKGSSRWMDSQRDDDWDDEERQNQQSHRESPNQRDEPKNEDSIGGNGDGDNDFQEKQTDDPQPPGTEDNDRNSFNEQQDDPEPINESNETSNNNVSQEPQDQPPIDDVCGGDEERQEENPGTTPLCDENESKE